MTENLSVKSALQKGRMMLSDAKIETAGLDAALLLMKAAGLSRTELATKQGQILTGFQQSEYLSMLIERAAHRPIAYILRTREFMGLDFYVDERVLIPRPDSESLCEAVLRFAKDFNEQGTVMSILDIGTGSGALAVAVARYEPRTEITALDICGDALAVAAINAEKHGVNDRVVFMQSNLYHCLKDGAKFDIIMSNPPYIRDDEILPDSVIKYEPRKALFAGHDGLYFYKIIIEGAKSVLTPRGMIFLEIGHAQREGIWRLLEDNGFTEIVCVRDLAGKDRVLCASAMNN